MISLRLSNVFCINLLRLVSVYFYVVYGCKNGVKMDIDKTSPLVLDWTIYARGNEHVSPYAI